MGGGGWAEGGGAPGTVKPKHFLVKYQILINLLPSSSDIAQESKQNKLFFRHLSNV